MEFSFDHWLANKRQPNPPRTLYQIVDRNLAIFARTFDVPDKGNILVGDTLIFPMRDSQPQNAVYFLCKNEWRFDERTYKGGAKKFITWYNKQKNNDKKS